MSHIDYMQIIGFVGIAGIWILVVWFARLLLTLKNGITAQKSIIDSFAAQSSYINNVQGTLSKLYDPKEIENIVTIKVEHARRIDFRESSKIMSDITQKNIVAPLFFIAHSLIYMSDFTIEEVLKNIRHKDESHFIEAFVRDTRKGILEVRNAEVAKYLARGPNNET